MRLRGDLFRPLGVRVEVDKSKYNYYKKYLIKNRFDNTLYTDLRAGGISEDKIIDTIIRLACGFIFIKTKAPQVTYPTLTEEVAKYSILDGLPFNLISYNVFNKLESVLSKYPPCEWLISDTYEYLNTNDRASYYTSRQVATYMCRQGIDRLLLTRTGASCISDVNPNDASAILESINICEPSVGSGNFIIILLETYSYYYDFFNIEYEKEALWRDVLKRTWVMDINPRSVWIMHLRLSILFKNEYKINTYVGDSVCYNSWNAFLPRPVCYNKHSLFEDRIYYHKDNIFRFEPFFDLVITNPPYLRGDELGNFEKYINCYDSYYTIKSGKVNLFAFSIEVVINMLKTDGVCSVIMPDRFRNTVIYLKFREFIKKYLNIDTAVILCGKNDFRDTDVYTGIFIFIKNRSQNDIKIAYSDTPDILKQINYDIINKKNITTKEFIFRTDLTPKYIQDCIYKYSIINSTLGYIKVTSARGHVMRHLLINGKDYKKILSNCISEAERIRTIDLLTPFHKYNTIQSYYTKYSHDTYFIFNNSNYLKYPFQNPQKREAWYRDMYPSVYNYLFEKKNTMRKNYNTDQILWYETCNFHNDKFDNKVLWPPYFEKFRSCLDLDNTFSYLNMGFSHSNLDMLFYLLGILNTSAGRVCVMLNHITYNRTKLTNVASFDTYRLPKLDSKTEPLAERLIQISKTIYYKLREDQVWDYTDLQMEADEIGFLLYRFDTLSKDIQKKMKNI